MLKLSVISAGAFICWGITVLSWAAVNEQEAAQLGDTLTSTGAELAGNADASIPAWDPTISFNSGDEIYVTDPMPVAKPLYVITKENMSQYEDKLSGGAKRLLSSKPDYRMDVYPTIRSSIAPDYFYANSRKNAVETTLSEDGLQLLNWRPGVPFPLPKTGLEAIWNHLVRYTGSHAEYTSTAYYVNSQSSPVVASTQFVSYSSPVYDHATDEMAGDKELALLRANFTGPARRAGEVTLVREPTNFSEGAGRKAWQYLAGQRRVRRAPDVSFDTPAPATAGNSTYDDGGIYNGSPERFDWELLGKQECIVPYNNWRLTNVAEPETLLLQHFFSPDAVRWELHRCWVVEATLKEGQRHIYYQRRYYLDEDSWTALMGDLYDKRGELWRANFNLFASDYVAKSFRSVGGALMYDFQSLIYSGGLPKPMTSTSRLPAKDDIYYTAGALKRSGAR